MGWLLSNCFDIRSFYYKLIPLIGSYNFEAIFKCYLRLSLRWQAQEWLLYSWRFSRYSASFHWLVHGHMTSNNETVSRQMPCAGNIAKAMTSNGKQFTVTRSTCWPLLHVMAGILAQFSNFAFVLFCYITNHLMTGPLGNSEFCFPRISLFPSTSSRETLRFSWNKIHCSPRDQSLSVYYHTLRTETYCQHLVGN